MTHLIVKFWKVKDMPCKLCLAPDTSLRDGTTGTSAIYMTSATDTTTITMAEMTASTSRSRCSQSMPCADGEGDCDHHLDCEGTLLCGNDNCASGPAGMDCCTDDGNANLNIPFDKFVSVCCINTYPYYRLYYD